MSIKVTMVSSLLITGLLVLISVAQASGHRPDTHCMSCEATKTLVKNSGAVILSTGTHTFDRYVANRFYCDPEQILKWAFVPTSDTHRCRLRLCVEISGDDEPSGGGEEPDVEEPDVEEPQ